MNREIVWLLRFVGNLGAGTAAAFIEIIQLDPTCAKFAPLLEAEEQILRRSRSELTCDERNEAVEYGGVEWMWMYFISRRWLGSCAPLTISNLA